MKKGYTLMFSLIMLCSLVLTACGPSTTSEAIKKGSKVKVVNLINGVQGDKSFFDSAVRGVAKAGQEFQMEVKTIEAGVDPAKWQPALEDAAANEEFDIMVLGTYQMSEFLAKVAPKYPDKKFIIYDASIDYAQCKCENVYSVLYKQNEGSYLAGVYAGLMTKAGIIGAIGGQDIPVINDFIVGYEQGAKSVKPDVKVIKQYVGGSNSWNDPAKGKELGLALYQQGADIIFQIAAGSGTGVFQAAQEMKQYAIGVDSDQATIFEGSNPEMAKTILTSMMKNVDNSLYRALKLYTEGKLPFGKAESLGVAEGGVGLAKNKIYEENTPKDVKEKIDQVEKDLLAGKIKVDSAYK